MIILLLLVTFLLFLRIDYRFKYTIECCSDEYDYFLHAETIVEDFDFDYSNQDLRDFRYNYGNKSAPVGFVGTGILLSPFLYIGNYFNNLFGESVSVNLFNFQILFYSLGSVFYFFLSYYFINKTKEILGYDLNKYKLLVYFAASGIPYYAFERFGMTHSSEVFTLSLLIFLLTKFYLESNNSKTVTILIAPILMISFLTRMSNFYLFLIPIIVRRLIIKVKKEVNSLVKNYYFLTSLIVTSLSYIWLINTIYGKFIFNPQKIYGDLKTTEAYFGTLSDLPLTFLEMIRTSFLILFTFEFGIFWVSPILFFGTIFTFVKLKEYKNIENWLMFFCFAQNFVIIYMWQSTASSYGFRYLLSLVPLTFFIMFIHDIKNKSIENYLFFFSIFSLLAILFFETTTLTQLSVTEEYNSFGRYIRYVEPNYVKGVFLSLFKLESYLIIFSTSFLGAIFFKLLLYFGRNSVESLLLKFGLPLENADFQIYLDNLLKIEFNKFLILIVFLFVSAYLITYKIKD